MANIFYLNQSQPVSGLGTSTYEVPDSVSGLIPVTVECKSTIPLSSSLLIEITQETYATFSGQVDGMTTDIYLKADTQGSDGDSIDLTFNGSDTIDDAIAAWNLANPSNTVSLEDGDGSQVPTNGQEIELSGGEVTYSNGGGTENPSPTQKSLGCVGYFSCQAGNLINVVLSSSSAVDALPNNVKSVIVISSNQSGDA